MIYLFIDEYNQKLRSATTDSMAKFVIIKITAFFDFIFIRTHYTTRNFFTSNTYEQRQTFTINCSGTIFWNVLTRDLKTLSVQQSNLK